MNSIEDRVMKRVRRIHLFRRFINRRMVKVYGVGVLSLALISMVSFTNVYANMPSLLSPAQLFRFLLQAVLNTETLVQIHLLLIAVVSTLFIRDMFERAPQRGVGNILARG